MNANQYMFNINNQVKFRLGSRGRKILREYYQQFSNLYSEEEIAKLVEPEDGFHTMQMHRMISIFGDGFTLGSECAIESCEIFFKEDDLKLVSL